MRWPWPTRQYLWRGWHRDAKGSRGLRARRLPSLNHLVVTGFRQGLRYIRWFQWAKHAFPFFIYIGVLFYMFSSYENIFGIVSLKVKPMWFNCLFTRQHNGPYFLGVPSGHFYSALCPCMHVCRYKYVQLIISAYRNIYSPSILLPLRTVHLCWYRWKKDSNLHLFNYLHFIYMYSVLPIICLNLSLFSSGGLAFFLLICMGTLYLRHVSH